MWVTNNWQYCPAALERVDEALTTLGGGQGVVVFYGMAKPVKVPGRAAAGAVATPRPAICLIRSATLAGTATVTAELLSKSASTLPSVGFLEVDSQLRVGLSRPQESQSGQEPLYNRSLSATWFGGC